MLLSVGFLLFVQPMGEADTSRPSTQNIIPRSLRTMPFGALSAGYISFV
jgi:hypothetical protein